LREIRSKKKKAVEEGLLGGVATAKIVAVGLLGIAGLIMYLPKLIDLAEKTTQTANIVADKLDNTLEKYEDIVGEPVTETAKKTGNILKLIPGISNLKIDPKDLWSLFTSSYEKYGDPEDRKWDWSAIKRLIFGSGLDIMKMGGISSAPSLPSLPSEDLTDVARDKLPSTSEEIHALFKSGQMPRDLYYILTGRWGQLKQLLGREEPGQPDKTPTSGITPPSPLMPVSPPETMLGTRIGSEVPVGASIWLDVYPPEPTGDVRGFRSSASQDFLQGKGGDDLLGDSLSELSRSRPIRQDPTALPRFLWMLKKSPILGGFLTGLGIKPTGISDSESRGSELPYNADNTMVRAFRSIWDQADMAQNRGFQEPFLKGSKISINVFPSITRLGESLNRISPDSPSVPALDNLVVTPSDRPPQIAKRIRHETREILKEATTTIEEVKMSRATQGQTTVVDTSSRRVNNISNVDHSTIYNGALTPAIFNPDNWGPQ